MLIYEGISKTGERVRGRFIGSKEELFKVHKASKEIFSQANG